MDELGRDEEIVVVANHDPDEDEGNKGSRGTEEGLDLGRLMAEPRGQGLQWLLLLLVVVGVVVTVGVGVVTGSL